MYKNYNVRYLKEGIEFESKFICDSECTELECRLADGYNIKVNGDNCFSMFNDIREKVGDSYTFLCQGAKKNVRMSNMGRDSGGILVYQLNLVKRPDIDDLVEIFAPAKLEEVSNLKDQIEFNNLWVSYLRDGKLK